MSSPGGPGGSSLVEASTTIAVAATSLSAAYNNTGISSNSDESAADYDGVGDSFSAEALAAGTPTALTQGGKVTVGGTTFTWPDVAPGNPDNVVAAGQTIALSGSGTDLGFLGSSQNGTASGTVTVHYTDGTNKSFHAQHGRLVRHAPRSETSWSPPPRAGTSRAIPSAPTR